MVVVAATALIGGALVGGSANGEGDGDNKHSSAATVDAQAREPSEAQATARRLNLRRLAGQRLIAGVPGTRIPAGLRRMIAAGELAGVILFADNFPDRAAGRRLIKRLQAIPRPAGLTDPLLIMIDQEGGLVKRVEGAPAVSAAEMGRRGAAYSRRQGRLTGLNLRDVGVNVDLAPVVDVARPGGDIDETGRAFGRTAARVTETALAFARGLRSAGVAATAKHFPGLGAVRINTDFAAQTIDLPKRTLRAVDFAPYRDFIAQGGELIMLSTAIYPAWSKRPAAFTREIVTGELRGRLGFEGVTITDAMGTVAVNDFTGPAQATLLAARSGVDLLLYTDHRSVQRAHRVLVGRLADGRLKLDPARRAVARILALRARLAGRA